MAATVKPQRTGDQVPGKSATCEGQDCFHELFTQLYVALFFFERLDVRNDVLDDVDLPIVFLPD